MNANNERGGEMTHLEISKIILAQLGGGRFLAMTGARNLVSAPGHSDEFGNVTGPTLTMKLPIGNVRHVSITLDPSDTYAVRCYNRAGRIVSELCGVYADSLRAVVSDFTGLCLSL